MLGTKSKFIIDFIPIADQYKVIESSSSVASFFASYVHTPHNKISDKIAQNNTNHGIRVGDRNRLSTFNVGDVQKLHDCSSSPFQILMKLNDNIYIIDLIDFGISSTFNLDCLVDYKGLDVIPLVDEFSHELIL